MDKFITQPVIIAATISAIVALSGTWISFLVQRLQLRSKTREVEEQNRQAQLLEVLKKRIECYPRLWEILISYTINWAYQGNRRDLLWANGFLEKLDMWNESHGLFFSHAAHVKFNEMRSFLVTLIACMKEGEIISPPDFKKLYHLFGGDPEKKTKGLGTHLKNDLGSYRIAAIQSSKKKPEKRKGSIAE